MIINNSSLINGIVGFGDGIYNGITLGLGSLGDIRDTLGINGDINSCSGSYNTLNTLGSFWGGATITGAGFTKAGWGLKADHAHSNLGPHLHYGPKYPGSNHPKWHFGPKNPNYGKGNFSWGSWWKGGKPWRWK